MNRRGFLGLFGGAVVAGPAVAKNALETATPIDVMPVITRAGTFTDLDDLFEPPSKIPTTAVPDKWMSDRIDSLKKLIRGEIDEGDDVYPVLVAAEMNIHALGSVSKSAKVRILRRRSAEIRIQMRKAGWIEELLLLEKRL